jgi:hypothetical protein
VGTDDIVAENIKALQALYFARLLEELRLFDVADRLVELYDEGLLPVGRGDGGSVLDAYRRGSRRRPGRAERLTLYARCFGSPGGDPAVQPNREFNELWLRFLRAVSSYRRQRATANVLADRRAASRETVRKTGRDLAANLSLHGFRTAPAAASLETHERGALDVLRTGAVRRAYGSCGVWELVEVVSFVELGHVSSTIRGRTAAHAGGAIIRWLATRAAKLSSRRAVLDARELRRLSKSATPRETPTDLDLIDACEQWLALGGASEQQVEQGPPLREVRASVERLLASSAAFALLPPAEQRRLARDLVKIATFLATPHGNACEHVPPPADQPWWALQDVDFPAFVAALVKGVFDAIVDSSIEQLREYARLVQSATRAVDEFVRDNAGADSARRWLAVTYPDVLALTSVERKAGRLTVIRDADAVDRVRADLCLQQPLSLERKRDEAVLVERARSRIARERQRLLATMVLMGIDRRSP